MNKTLKIGILSFALVGAFIYGITGTSAADNHATVKLTDGSNSCTGTDYDFGSFAVSTNVQTGTATGSLSCKFLNSQSGSVTYLLNDLSAGGGLTIPRTGATLKANNAQRVTGNLNEDSALSTHTPFSATALTVYSKQLHKVGTMTQANEMKLTIPANQPAGTYTGTLIITVSP